MLIGIAIGFVLGVIATVAYNFFFPTSVDKASAELVQEVGKLKKK